MAKPKSNTMQRSAFNVFTNSAKSRKALNNTWNVSARAPLFCTMKSIGGETAYRTKRLINKHAIHISASGAASNAAQIMRLECDRLRVESLDEYSRAPWLPVLSSGARMMLEQFLCSLAQEATYKAHIVREGSCSAKRLNTKHVELGWDNTVQAVFGNNMLIPKTVLMHTQVKKTKNCQNNDQQSPRKDEK